MVYQWKEGAHVKLDPTVAAGEFERIRNRDGKIEASVVVNEARPARSPLHSAFEWDDYVAAEEYRRTQARYMIRSLEVAPEGEDPVPVYVIVRPAGSEPGYYQEAQVAVNNPDEWQLVMEEAESALVAAQRKLDRLQSLAKGKGRKVASLIKKANAGLEAAREAMTELSG
jgi:hypothetical protein